MGKGVADADKGQRLICLVRQIGYPDARGGTGCVALLRPRGGRRGRSRVRESGRNQR